MSSRLSWALSSPFRMSKRVDIVLFIQQLVVIGATAGQLLPSSLSWLSQVFTDISIVNLDVNMWHPGCAIAALSYVDVFWATLVIVILAALLFTVAAAVRTLLIVRHLDKPLPGCFRSWRRPASRAGLQLPAESRDTMQDDNAAQHTIQDRVAVMAYITSWPSPVRADVSAGFGLGRWKTLRWRAIFSERALQNLFICCSLAYLRVTTVVLQVLHCSEVMDPAGDSQLVLLVDRRTLCYQGAHQAAAALAWLLLFGYSIGYPILLFFVLRRVHSLDYVAGQLVQLQVPSAKLNSTQPPSSPKQSFTTPVHHPASTSHISDPYDDRADEHPFVGDRTAVPSSHAAEEDTQRSVDEEETNTGEGLQESSQDLPLQDVHGRVAALRPVWLQACVKLNALTSSEASQLDADYLFGCVEQVLLHRFARYGYLLFQLRDSYHYFALLPLVISFALACTVALPSAIYVQVFVAAFAFVTRCVVVAVLWPFAYFYSNIIAMAATLVLVVQCCIALGLIQTFSVSSASGSGSGAPQLDLQQRLSQTTVHFLSANKAFIGVLCAVIVCMALLSCVACSIRRRRAIEKERRLDRVGTKSATLTFDPSSVSAVGDVSSTPSPYATAASPPAAMIELQSFHLPAHRYTLAADPSHARVDNDAMPPVAIHIARGWSAEPDPASPWAAVHSPQRPPIPPRPHLLGSSDPYYSVVDDSPHMAAYSHPAAAQPPLSQQMYSSTRTPIPPAATFAELAILEYQRRQRERQRQQQMQPLSDPYDEPVPTVDLATMQVQPPLGCDSDPYLDY